MASLEKVQLQISGSFSPFFAGANLRFRSLEVRQPTPLARNSGPSLRDFAALAVDLREAQQGLLLDGRRYRSNGVNGQAVIRSASSLGLSATASATTLGSSEEVNATPTSFSPSSPAFEGSSSSSPFVGGTYSGENGDTTLTVQATVGGAVGVTPVQFEVRDSDSNLVDTVSLGFSPAGTVFTIANGIELSFSAGTVQLGDQFEVDVFQSVGSVVREDNPFDQVGDPGAGFEAGLGVSAGSFDVNGVSITVNGDDTLSAVLARITASAAGVSAGFDAATESVQLIQKSTGAAFDILLENDSSGFLAATKLDGAASVLGADDDTQRLIGEVSALSGVQSGDFSINGVQLSVDVLQDSLADLIERINNSGAGVSASYDAASGKFRIQGNGSASVSLEDGTSNLLASLNLADGSFVGSSSRSKTVFQNQSALRRGLEEFAEAYEALFQDSFSGFGSASIASIRSQLDGLVTQAFRSGPGLSDEGTLRSGLGIDLEQGSGSQRTLAIDGAGLSRAFRQDSLELEALLFSNREEGDFDGIVTAVGERLELVLGTLGKLLGEDAVGLNLDVSA